MFRPDLTDYDRMTREIAQKMNSDSWASLSKTDVTKIAIERLYKDAFPEKHIQRMKRKYFILAHF